MSALAIDRGDAFVAGKLDGRRVEDCPEKRLELCEMGRAAVRLDGRVVAPDLEDEDLVRVFDGAMPEVGDGARLVLVHALDDLLDRGLGLRLFAGEDGELGSDGAHPTSGQSSARSGCGRSPR